MDTDFVGKNGQRRKLEVCFIIDIVIWPYLLTPLCPPRADDHGSPEAQEVASVRGQVERYASKSGAFETT